MRYAFLWNYVQRTQGCVYVYIDSLGFSGFRTLLFSQTLATIEFFLWCWINKIPRKTIKIITCYTKIIKNDVLFSFAHGNFGGPYNDRQQRPIAVNRKKVLSSLNTIPAIKIVHLTHFMFDCENVSHNLQQYNPDILVAESNLKQHSDLFKRKFCWFNGDVAVLPYAPQGRFKSKTDFLTRRSMAVAVGTLLYKINDPVFRTLYPDGELHPLRRRIYDYRAELVDILDCRIMETEEVAREETPQTLRQKVVSLFRGGQSKYFSFDIVEVYNGYQMFLAPEEVTGLPSPSFAEGMACGCVLITSKPEIYLSLGMQKGVHFIYYDGSITGLSQVIKESQKNPELLNKISIAGKEIANNLSAGDKICKEFLNRFSPNF